MLERLKVTSIIAFLAMVFIIGCGKTGTQTSDKPKDENNQTVQTPVTGTESNNAPDVNKTETETGSNKTDEINTKTEVNSTNSGDVTVIKLPTIQCDNCKKNITKALNKVDGVSGFAISVEGKTAKIKFDKSKTDISKIENAITAAGYDVNDKKADPEAYAKLDDCCKLPKDRK